MTGEQVNEVTPQPAEESSTSETGGMTEEELRAGLQQAFDTQVPAEESEPRSDMPDQVAPEESSDESDAEPENDYAAEVAQEAAQREAAESEDLYDTAETRTKEELAELLSKEERKSQAEQRRTSHQAGRAGHFERRNKELEQENHRLKTALFSEDPQAAYAATDATDEPLRDPYQAPEPEYAAPAPQPEPSSEDLQQVVAEEQKAFIKSDPRFVQEHGEELAKTVDYLAGARKYQPQAGASTDDVRAVTRELLIDAKRETRARVGTVDQAAALRDKKRVSAAAATSGASAAPRRKAVNPMTMPLGDLRKALDDLSNR